MSEADLQGAPGVFLAFSPVLRLRAPWRILSYGWNRSVSNMIFCFHVFPVTSGSSGTQRAGCGSQTPTLVWLD